MSAEQALLRSVLEAPDEDAPRLVYADWLEENGQGERAEFIRLQIDLANDPQDSPKRREKAFRARQLLDAHKEWGGLLRRAVHEMRFIRGFVEKIDLSGEVMGAYSPDLFATTPVRRLGVTGLGGNLKVLERIPGNNSLTGLDLAGNELGLEALQRLARFRRLRGLRTLGLLFNAIDDAGARFLCESPFFQKLSLIRCGANPISEAARQELRAHFGDRVSFACERDDDHLYAFEDDYGFMPGFVRDHRQVLMLAGYTEARAAFFDHEGNLLDIQRRPISQDEGSSGDQRDAARRRAVEAWQKELRFESRTIKVKRFQFDEREGIRDFNWWRQAFDGPNHPERFHLIPAVAGWLAEGKFEWNFGRDNCWLDRTGEVTDT